MRLASERPSPQPLFLVVKPGRKTFRMSLLRMPLPVSVTSTTAYLFSSNTFSVMVPSPPIASTAFFDRFSITHSKSEAFIFT